MSDSEKLLSGSARAKFNNPDRLVRVALMGFVLLRLLISGLIWLDVVPIGRDGWKLYHGGDEALMAQLAASILYGQPVASVVSLGQALVAAFWFWLYGVLDYGLIVPPLTVINGLVLGSLSVWLVGKIALGTTGRRDVALASAYLWAMAPAIAYAGFFWHPDFLRLRDTVTPRIGWLNGLADGPGMFFILAGVAIAAGCWRQGRDAKFGSSFWIGLMAGMAVTFRIHMAFMALPLLGAVLLIHGWQHFAIAVAGSIAGYLPQAVYNQVVFGFPVWTGYISLLLKPDSTLNSFWINHAVAQLLFTFNPTYLVTASSELISQRPSLLITGWGGLLVLIVAVFRIWKLRGWQAVLLLFVLPLAYLFALSISGPFRSDIIRFSMPVMPSMIIAVMFVLLSFVPAPAAATAHSPETHSEEEG